jgi:2-deoxy-D-gluconate 3-dehydrogenase
MHMKSFNLKGKVAIVTGGNGGIGLGMARGMALCGASVVLAGRNAAKAKDALASLAEFGDTHRFITADVTKAAACQSLVAETLAQFARLDILVNNAGTSVRKRPELLSEAEWRHVIDTNLTSALFCAQAAYPALKASGRGKIINIGSMMSLFGAPYAVNAVLPGWIDTALTRGAREQVDGLHQRVLDRTPAGRWGVADDMAGIAAFLAGPGSDFVTGAAIPVDGGFSIVG